LQLSVLAANTYGNGQFKKRNLYCSVVREKRVSVKKTSYRPFTTV